MDDKQDALIQRNRELIVFAAVVREGCQEMKSRAFAARQFALAASERADERERQRAKRARGGA